MKVSELLENIFEWIIDLVAKKQESCPRTIIFCASVKMCAELYTAFQMSLSVNDFCYVNMFHSCTADEVKEKIRKDRENMNGTTRILIATSAAGMGVNYQEVHDIVHWGPHRDLDGFVQQLGRAGRYGTQ